MTTTIKTSTYAVFALVLAFAFATSAFAANFISESKAISIAESEYNGSGEQTDVELEKKEGTTVYAVEFTESDDNEVDVYIDAKTGEFIGMESDANETDGEEDDEGDEDGEENDDESDGDGEQNEDEEEAALKAQAKVSQTEALTIAENAYTGSGSFSEMEIDDESGAAVWEVSFVDASGNEVEVHVDAMSGKVLGEQDGVEEDDDDEEVTSVAGMQKKLISLLQQLISLLQLQR